MENVKFIEIETFSGIETHAVITLSDDSYTSMLKSDYDAMKANEAKTK